MLESGEHDKTQVGLDVSALLESVESETFTGHLQEGEVVTGHLQESVTETETEEKKPVKSNPYATRKIKRIDSTMLRACELMAMKDINGMSNDDIARELGINRATLYRWRQRPEFNDKLTEITEEFQRSFLTDAYAELRKIMMYGKSHEKLKAIELLLKNQGRLKEVKETTAKVEQDLNVTALFKELGI